MSAEPSPQLTEAAPGRRERRKAETRRRLLAAARELFAAHGFEATRPQDIARRAGVASGTFYLHFADRRAAFLAVTAETAEELMERARARAEGAAGFEAGLSAYLDELLDYADEHPGVLRVLFADEGVIASHAGGAGGAGQGESLRDRLAGSLAGGVAAAMEAGEMHADADPRLLAYGVVGFIQQALSYGAASGLERAAVLDQIAHFCGRALLARPRPESSP